MSTKFYVIACLDAVKFCGKSKCTRQSGMLGPV